MKKSALERLNFFKGLFTTAEDWQAEQAYHIQKRQLHFRGLHYPGVVPGEGQDLKVEAGVGGRFRVLPGYAVDAEGRDLYLSEVEEVTPPQDAYGGKDSYIYIAYREEPVEESKRTNPSNESYSGYAFTRERPIVSWETTPYDDGLKIELARFRLRAGDGNPKIDRSRVPYVRAKLSGAIRRVASQEIDVDPQRETSWVFDKFADENQAASAFYQVNVCPKPTGSGAGATVSWRVESFLDKEGSIAYRVVVTNQSTVQVRAQCVIWRTNLQSLL